MGDCTNCAALERRIAELEGKRPRGGVAETAPFMTPEERRRAITSLGVVPRRR